MGKKLVYSVACLSVAAALAGCGIQPAIPNPAMPPCQVYAGSSIELVADNVAGNQVTLHWSAALGQVSPSQGSVVTYTAPHGFAGNVTIELTTTRDSQSVTEELVCKVMMPPTPTPTSTPPPTATATPLPPTATPTPTPTPPELDLSLVTPVSGGAAARALVYEAEASGAGDIPDRSLAFGKRTAHLATDERIEFEIKADQEGSYILYIRHSNDNINDVETETLLVSLDGTQQPGAFHSVDTGDGGAGWNVFVHPWFGDLYLSSGVHTITLLVEGGDDHGIDIDAIVLVPR